MMAVSYAIELNFGRDFVRRGGGMGAYCSCMCRRRAWLPRGVRTKVQAKTRARFRGHVHTGDTWHAEGKFTEVRKVCDTVIDSVRRF